MMKLLRPAAGLVALASFAIPCGAEIPSDAFVQSDRFHSQEVEAENRYAIDETVNEAHFRYVKSMLAEGYPLRSIILHALTQGISVSDTAHLIVLVEHGLGADEYRASKELLPLMPGWVCGLMDDTDLRYPLYYPADSLGPEPTIEAVARLYFDEGRFLGYRNPAGGNRAHPDWTKGEYHLQANVDELITLSRAERRDANAGTQDGLWYQTRPNRPGAGEDGAPILVSLYKKGRRIVVDAPESRLVALRDSGTATAPVIFIYNGSHAIPLSELVAGDTDTRKALERLTVDAVANHYFRTGERVTPPREWHDSDFHILAPVTDIRKLYRRAAKTQDASKAREQVAEEIQGEGFWPPVKITLNVESGLLWADSEARVAAAEKLGLEQVPVVFFYHEIHRLPCAAEADCEAAICRAVVSAGGESGVDRCPAPGDRS